MKSVKKLNIFSFARFNAILFGFIGLGFGILYSVGGAIYDLATTGLNMGSALAFGALIGMPLIGIIAGLTISLIESILYTLISKWIKIDTDFFS